MNQITLPLQPERRIYSVSELTQAVQQLLAEEFSDIWVVGEISGVKEANSGHIYFSLKEENSLIRCVCFRNVVRYLPFLPQDGIAVLARGRLDFYDARGEFQFIVEFLEPQGLGALQLAFEQLKKKLAAEGLFDKARKRNLRRFSWHIGIVTSPRGAVIQDMLHILRRRFPGLHIRIYPVQVQGPGSVEQICEGLRYFSESNWADVVILARGGGSLEDLWSFNEEAVARAIADCSVPVISAVGHETDFTIADFVADLRAPTPSAAAELVVCVREDLLDKINALEDKLLRAVRLNLTRASHRYHQLSFERIVSSLQLSINRKFQLLDDLHTTLRDHMREKILRRSARLQQLETRLHRQDLRLRLGQWHQRLQEQTSRLKETVSRLLNTHSKRLLTLEAHLKQLSPLRALERGYALVQTNKGELVKSARQVSPGNDLTIRLAEGRLGARVTEVHPDGS